MHLIGQSVFTYCLLLLTSSPLFIRKVILNNEKRICLLTWFKSHLIRYAFLGFLEVEANFLAVKAYAYTSVVSVQILDSCTLPVIFVLSMILLKRRYYVIHYIALTSTIIGTSMLIYFDHSLSKANANSTEGSVPSKAYIGNIMMAAAASIYGLTNVLQEMILRKRPTVEYIFSLSLCTCIISSMQTFIFERSSIQSAEYDNWQFVSYFIGFILSLYGFYIMIPLQLKKHGCVVFNMNLQTSDVYTLLAGTLLFKNKFSGWYIVAWCLIVISTLMYNYKEPINKADTSSGGIEHSVDPLN
ncbi:hypothetical protein GJ496_004997 [Pomphorhynchus laevis]|nr:hypothetical protein GJ496_004997 [Pomphorhynchus laevis]